MAALYMKPILKIDERYDNNPEYASDAEATSGFVTVISPSLEFSNQMRNLNIIGSYGAESYFYQSAPELNYMGHSLNLGMDSELNRYESVNGGLSLVYSEDSLSTLETGIQTERTRVVSGGLNLSYVRLIDAERSIEASLSGDISEFENPVLVDTATTQANITGRRSLTRDLSAELGYELGYFMFDGTAASSNTIAHSVEAGMNYTVTPGLEVGATIGTAYFIDDDNAFDWTGSMLVQKAFKSTSVNLKYSRELTHSAGLEEGLNDRDALSAGLMHSITSSLSVSVAGFASRYSPIRPGAIDTISYGGDLRVLYQPVSWMAVGGGYSRFHQFEDEDGGERLNREQAYLTVTLHPFEWRLN
jgi:hypothetical protein